MYHMYIFFEKQISDLRVNNSTPRGIEITAKRGGGWIKATHYSGYCCGFASCLLALGL